MMRLGVESFISIKENKEYYIKFYQKKLNEINFSRDEFYIFLNYESCKFY
jgi:hypothetical protein